jgi:hypothetical protein
VVGDTSSVGSSSSESLIIIILQLPGNQGAVFLVQLAQDSEILYVNEIEIIIDDFIPTKTFAHKFKI